MPFSDPTHITLTHKTPGLASAITSYIAGAIGLPLRHAGVHSINGKDATDAVLAVCDVLSC